MAERIVQEESLVAVADAIRAKGGTTDALSFPTGFANAIAAIQAGGGGESNVEDEIVTRTITEYSNNRINKIGKYAFRDCSALTAVNFSAITQIEDYAFYRCSKLIEVNAPNVTSIGNSALRDCSALTEANYPFLTTVSDYAFSGTGLTRVDFPLLTRLSANLFKDCSKLTDVNIPSATSVDYYVFSGCKSLVTIVLPKAEKVNTEDFYNCTALVTVDCPVATNIASNAFKYCSALTRLILRSETMCTLGNANAFTGAPIKSGGTGYIYVPSTLIATYQADSKWSTFASQFRALEDYTVDGTITGELDETKI